MSWILTPSWHDIFEWRLASPATGACGSEPCFHCHSAARFGQGMSIPGSVIKWWNNWDCQAKCSRSSSHWIIRPQATPIVFWGSLNYVKTTWDQQNNSSSWHCANSWSQIWDARQCGVQFHFGILGHMPESLPWLKKATILHTEIEGSSHPNTKKYRDDFIKLTKEVSPQPDYDRLTLSDEDTAAMKALLGAGISLGWW